ncbi:OmpA family protein [Rhodanobacter sp. DHG33]|nr:OmpA family protein [Rhodanobacter sp. DHG33]
MVFMVLAVLMVLLVLSGCGNVSHRVANDGKSAGELVWPEPGDTTPIHANGTWPTLDSLRQVHAGESKNQIAALIGFPHFSEGVVAVREWNYLFHFRTADHPDTVCQYKVLFDDAKLAQSFYWKPASCAEMLKATPAAPVAAAAEQHFTLSADALFAFDKSSLEDIKPDGRTQLDKLAAQITGEGQELGMVHVIGYTDRLGSDDHNDRLSQKRAYTVMEYLMQHGVPSRLIVAEGRGSVAPVTTDCSQDDRAALIACLAPDRRVEIIVIGRHSDS